MSSPSRRPRVSSSPQSGSSENSQFSPNRLLARSSSACCSCRWRFSSRISVIRLITSPKAETSSGSPVMPITPSSLPPMVTGRLMPCWTPSSGASRRMTREGRFSRMIRSAPWCTCPWRTGSVLARMTPFSSMMLMSRWMAVFISSTMLRAFCLLIYTVLTSLVIFTKII